ncbi:TetR/AcrR family transcriptional regulator [Celeribacter halophilus]|uniref:TetR/AcrR family transcriptional regulator n=1 Tax=Celeribacter halophilus TaxID=576117 RepID=UPI003A909C22
MTDTDFAQAGPSKAIETILLAAEVEFAEHGFDGAGMKAISKRAGLSQALLHYHFGTKDRLYEEVIGQRSKKINDERMRLLTKVDMRSHEALDGILEALFLPPLGPSGGAKPYARIFSGLIVGREREQALVKEYYDPTAINFIAALQTALPGLDRPTAAMCYTLALGTLIAVIGRDGRVERLMGRSAKQDIDDYLKSIVAFAKGGVLALEARR